MGWVKVPEATQEDAYHLLMNKVPMFILNWIVEEQTLRSRRRHVVALRMSPQHQPESVQRMIKRFMEVECENVIKI